MLARGLSFLLVASCVANAADEIDRVGMTPAWTFGGGLVRPEGGAPCGDDAAAHLASVWDALPLPAGSPAHARVEIALVARSHGSVTDWYSDPIRIEVADYGSCAAAELVVRHELGHAVRALFAGDASVFPASATDPATARWNADRWAQLLGFARWEEIAPAAFEACGSDADHCALATEELFAEIVRRLWECEERPGGWCEGPLPCWIYGFPAAFPDPCATPGWREWLDETVATP